MICAIAFERRYSFSASMGVVPVPARKQRVASLLLIFAAAARSDIRFDGIHKILHFGELTERYQVHLVLSDNSHQVDTSCLEEIFSLDLSRPLSLKIDSTFGDPDTFREELQKYPGTITLQ